MEARQCRFTGAKQTDNNRTIKCFNLSSDRFAPFLFKLNAHVGLKGASVKRKACIYF